MRTHYCGEVDETLSGRTIEVARSNLFPLHGLTA